MLKHQIASLDEVDEKYRDLYTATDDGFQIEVEGVSEMKRAKDREKDRAKAAETSLKELTAQIKEQEEAAAAAAKDDAKGKGDVDALEKSWLEKYGKRESELQGSIDELQGSLRGVLIDREAIRLASELSIEGSADVLFPHIKARLSSDKRDGKYVTVVLDAEGKPSASTLDELKAEFAGSKAFAPLIVGSKATGSGATGGNGGSAAPRGNMGGSKEERTNALRSKYPELAQQN